MDPVKGIDRFLYFWGMGLLLAILLFGAFGLAVMDAPWPLSVLILAVAVLPAVSIVQEIFDL